jgi:predicted DsbA family dithiol-disulfide isomerase
MTAVPIVYFSDVLCIWAYFSEMRVRALKEAFGEQIRFDHRFCSIFGDTARKMSTTWRDKGGHEGFNRHLMEVTKQFPEVTINPNIWLTAKPASSTGAHLFLKAVQLDETAGLIETGTFEVSLQAMRTAFFRDARDIGQWSVQCQIAEQTGVEVARIEALIHNGSAYASLASDHEAAASMNIQGSPTLVLNDGRQKLYGNVGYRILEANIQELLRSPTPDQASWC